MFISCGDALILHKKDHCSVILNMKGFNYTLLVEDTEYGSLYDHAFFCVPDYFDPDISTTSTGAGVPSSPHLSRPHHLSCPSPRLSCPSPRLRSPSPLAVLWQKDNRSRTPKPSLDKDEGKKEGGEDGKGKEIKEEEGKNDVNERTEDVKNQSGEMKPSDLKFQSGGGTDREENEDIKDRDVGTNGAQSKDSKPQDTAATVLLQDTVEPDTSDWDREDALVQNLSKKNTKSYGTLKTETISESVRTKTPPDKTGRLEDTEKPKLKPKPASKWMNTERRESKEFVGAPKAQSALANIMESLDMANQKLMDRINEPGLSDLGHIPVPKAKSMPELMSSLQLSEFPDDALDSNTGDDVQGHAQSDSEESPSGPIIDAPLEFKTKGPKIHPVKIRKSLKSPTSPTNPISSTSPKFDLTQKPKISQKPDVNIKALKSEPSSPKKLFADTKLSKPAPKSPKPVEIPKVSKLVVDTKAANFQPKGVKPMISPKKPKRTFKEQRNEEKEENNNTPKPAGKEDREEKKEERKEDRKDESKEEKKEGDTDVTKVDTIFSTISVSSFQCHLTTV